MHRNLLHGSSKLHYFSFQFTSIIHTGEPGSPVVQCLACDQKVVSLILVHGSFLVRGVARSLNFLLGPYVFLHTYSSDISSLYNFSSATAILHISATYSAVGTSTPTFGRQWPSGWHAGRSAQSPEFKSHNELATFL